MTKKKAKGPAPTATYLAIKKRQSTKAAKAEKAEPKAEEATEAEG